MITAWLAYTRDKCHPRGWRLCWDHGTGAGEFHFADDVTYKTAAEAIMLGENKFGQVAVQFGKYKPCPTCQSNPVIGTFASVCDECADICLC